MQLLKVRDGLAERDNFYMTSSFPDFLGVGTTHRDSNFFYIDADTKIERLFNYSSFVIELRKENWVNANPDDAFIFYIGSSVDEFGIVDVFGDTEPQHEYQKIMVLDGFIQCYVSDDGFTWENVGGVNMLGTTVGKQGFRKVGNTPLKLMEYSVYLDPYLTLQNFPENYKTKLYDSSGTFIKERLFDSTQECKIALDKSLNDAYIEVYDEKDTLVFTSNAYSFNYGDVFIACEFELELIYKGTVVDEDETTMMDTRTMPEIVTLKNISSTETYTNLNITTEIASSDTVELSLDGINFATNITIPSITPLEEIDIFVRIIRAGTTNTFVVRDFLFKVE